MDSNNCQSSSSATMIEPLDFEEVFGQPGNFRDIRASIRQSESFISNLISTSLLESTHPNPQKLGGAYNSE